MASNEEILAEPLADHEESIDYAQADAASDTGRPSTLHTLEDPPRRVKRREVEARRYSGKENVEDYLLQFQLTSLRNGWGETEKSAALLCALDGPARGILAEFDDPITASFANIKQALLRRFGPTQLVEVHEQALSQLRLAKGQNIRELAHEVQKLIKLAYPDIIGTARDRFAVKSLLHAISDRDTVFYIREKNPKDAAEACTLYERYMAHTGEDNHHRKTGIRGVNHEPPQPTREAAGHETQSAVSETLQKISETTNQQLQKLADAVSKLHNAVTNSAPQAATPTPTPAPIPPCTNPPPQSQVPRKPCPRCGMPGHWSRDCPAQTRQAPPTNVCYRCGQPGHYQRNCTMPLNASGSAPAPSVGPRPHLRQ